MKKNIIVILAVAFSLGIGACSNEAKQTETKKDTIVKADTTPVNINYTIGENYFVKNNFSIADLKNNKIETKENFDKIFGSAARMGEKGMPTEINFDKQFVIAIVEEQSEFETKISPVSLIKTDSANIKFTYKIEKSEVKQSFRTQPCLIIIVDKTNTENITLIKE